MRRTQTVYAAFLILSMGGLVSVAAPTAQTNESSSISSLPPHRVDAEDYARNEKPNFLNPTSTGTRSNKRSSYHAESSEDEDKGERPKKISRSYSEGNARRSRRADITSRTQLRHSQGRDGKLNVQTRRQRYLSVPSETQRSDYEPKPFPDYPTPTELPAKLPRNPSHSPAILVTPPETSTASTSGSQTSAISLDNARDSYMFRAVPTESDLAKQVDRLQIGEKALDNSRAREDHDMALD